MDPFDGTWHHAISPHVWLPGIRSTMRFQVPDVSVASQSTDDIRDDLSGAFELEGEARRGRRGVHADLDRAGFTSGKGP